MIPSDRPDLLQAALKKILKATGSEVSEGVSFNDQDTAAWSRFCAEYGVKNGQAGQPDYGAMPPLLRAWADSLVDDIESDAKGHGLNKVVESKNHPSPSNYLPNVGDGTPPVKSDADGNPIYQKVDKDGNPVDVTAADQAQLRKVLNSTVGAGADAEQTKGLENSGSESDASKTGDGENSDAGSNANPNGSSQQAGKEETPAQSAILPGANGTAPAGEAAKEEDALKNADGSSTLTPNSQPGGPRRPDQGKPNLNPASTGGSVRVRTN